MRRTGLAVAAALVVLAVGCGSDDEAAPTGEGTAAPTTPRATQPTDDVDALVEALATDALAIDPRAEVVDPSTGTPEFFDALIYLDSEIATPGSMSMPSTFTIRYPRLDDPAHARDFLRLFKEHGFGTRYGYTPEDFAEGRVQKTDRLRCRVQHEQGVTWFQCVTFDFADFVEYDVADEVTSLYADETGSKSLDCWYLLYPKAADDEPPLGTVLETGLCGQQSETRAYVDEGDGWQLVAQVPGRPSESSELRDELCASEHRDAFGALCA